MAFSSRHGVVAAGAVAGAGAGAALGALAGTPIWATTALLAVLVPIATIDLERRIVPNALVAAGIAVALLGAAIADPPSLPARLAATAAAGLFLGVPAVAAPAAMGMGDAKLAAMLGAFLAAGAALALLGGLLAATLAGVAVAARRGLHAARRTTLPLAPFLAGGAIVAVALGAMPP